ncbi:MAG: PDZ domain-containing protein [Campylobacteraceae bacterium]|jgi:hypothetical protein|nr:PDZ domain-containing protein [Campylobacteraceae bacterium]
MKNIIKISFFMLIILLFASCSGSGYSQFYKPIIENNKTTVELLNKDGEPKLIHSSSDNIENDILEVISNHYIAIGTSGFIGTNQEGALKSFAKSIGAVVVLYDTQYANSEQMTLFLPTTETSTINLNTYGNAGTFNKNGFASTNSFANTYGTVTTSANKPFSYKIDKYNHTAIFFARDTSKKRFGIFPKPFTNQIRKTLQRNNGILVGAVYKGTPAFNANILSDDLIISINDIGVSENNFSSVIDTIPSDERIKVVLLRSGQEKTLYIVLE